MIWTHHLFFPPRPATGIQLRINNAPKTPYAGSILMWNGIQSSPSFHCSACVELAKVELAPTIVPFPSVVLTGDEVFSVRVSVRKDVAELEPEGPGTSDVIVVVIV